MREKVDRHERMTHAERDRFEKILARSTPVSASADTPQWVDNVTALAKAIGCNRKTLQRYMAGEHGDDWPRPDGKKHDASAWRRWIKSKGLRVVARTEHDKNALDCELLKLKIEEQELENAERRGDLIAIDEAVAILSPLFSAFQAELRASKNDLAQEVVGLTVPEAAKRIARRHTQALEVISLGEGIKKKPFWRRLSAQLSALLETFSPGDGPPSIAVQPSA